MKDVDRFQVEAENAAILWAARMMAIGALVIGMLLGAGVVWLLMR